jgi:hypothetical protein
MSNREVEKPSIQAEEGPVMAKPKWEGSLTTAKAKARKEKKLILMDFYNNL